MCRAEAWRDAARARATSDRRRSRRVHRARGRAGRPAVRRRHPHPPSPPGGTDAPCATPTRGMPGSTPGGRTLVVGTGTATTSRPTLWSSPGSSGFLQAFEHVAAQGFGRRRCEPPGQMSQVATLRTLLTARRGPGGAQAARPTLSPGRQRDRIRTDVARARHKPGGIRQGSPTADMCQDGNDCGGHRVGLGGHLPGRTPNPSRRVAVADF